MRIILLILLAGIFSLQMVHAATEYPASNPFNAIVYLKLESETSDFTANEFGPNAQTFNVETTDYFGHTIISGVHLDGVDEYVNSTKDGIGMYDAWTMFFWINFTGVDDSKSYVQAGIQNTHNYVSLAEMGSASRIHLHFRKSDGSEQVGKIWNGASTLLGNGLNHSVAIVKRGGSCAAADFTMYIDGVVYTGSGNDDGCTSNYTIAGAPMLGGFPGATFQQVGFDEFIYFNRELDNVSIVTMHAGNYSGAGGGGGLSLNFSAINCTSCNIPFGDNVAPYTTSDTTPTFNFTTGVNANCRVDDSNINHSIMVTNCTGGEGSTSHACTLHPDDTLVLTPTDYMYISCVSTTNGGLTNTTELEIDITSYDATAGDAIDLGIHSSKIWPGATIYSNQQVYLRNLANTQVTATVDRVAVYNNQRWIISYDSSTPAGLSFNISPAVFVLDLINMSNESIVREISGYINRTKS